MREADEQAALLAAEAARSRRGHRRRTRPSLPQDTTPPHGDPLADAAEPADAAVPVGDRPGAAGRAMPAAGGSRRAGADDERRREADAAAAEQRERDAEAARLETERKTRAAAAAGRGSDRRGRRTGSRPPRASASAPCAANGAISAPALTGEPDVAARFAELDTQMTAREAEAHEADARARREALARLHNLLGRVEPLTANAELSLKAAERALRDVRTALGAMPQLPSKQDYDEAMRRLKAAQTALTPKVQELREADDWQRLGNVAVQEQLCAKMEALEGGRGSGSDRPRGARAAAAVARSRRRAARPGRRAVAPLQGRARRGLGARAKRISPPGAGARREPREEGRACASRPKRSPSRPTGFRPPTRSRSCRPSGRRSARSRAAARKRSGIGSAPPAIGSSPAATTTSPSARRSGPRTWRRRTRCARGPRRWPSRPTGTRPPPRSSGCRPSGRRSVRSRRAVRSDLAALPRRLRRVLRALRAAPRHRARRAGRGARGDLRRARSACCRVQRGR